MDAQSHDQYDDSYEPIDKKMSYRYGKRMTYRYGKRDALKVMPYRFGKRSVRDIQDNIDNLKEHDNKLKLFRNDKRMSY